jgi:hypothetical protein
LAAAAALMSPPAAHAATRLALPDGTVPAREQRWVDRSFVPTPNVDVALVRGPCPGGVDGNDGVVVGCTIEEAGREIVYLDRRAGGGRFDFLHELGHVFDDVAMTDLARVRFRAIMHDTNPGWDDPYPGELGYDTPAERFADSYALCALRRRLVADSLDNDLRWAGAGNGRALSSYGYRPTEFQHRKVCRLIRQTAPLG